MSTGRRAYDLLRGYVNQEWERIRGLEVWDALKELDSPVSGKKAEAAEEGATLTSTSKIEDPKAAARRILGVSETASFEEIRKAFEKLNKRSDPTNFPKGSEEQIQAISLQKRVNWAYHQLTDGVDIIEKRFKSLEIED